MKRIFDARLRKIGDHYMVMIPKEIIDRFKLAEKDFLGVTIDTEETLRNVDWLNKGK